MNLTRRGFLCAAGIGALGGALNASPELRARLGVTTDEIDDDLLVAIRLLKEFGLSLAEIRNVWGRYNTAQPVEKIREARALMDANGMKTSVLGTGFFKIPMPAETPEGQATLDAQWQLLDGAFERARILGASTLRIFAFNYDKGAKAATDRQYARACELLKEAAARAARASMRLAIENVSDSYVTTGADAAKFLAQVKHGNLGLTWDPNNAGMAGEKSFPDGYGLLDPARIFHVHLRDYRKNAEGKVEWCAVGEGEFDNVGQLRALLKAGYRGNFTLETHFRHPQGKAMATRVSLTELVKVFDRV